MFARNVKYCDMLITITSKSFRSRYYIGKYVTSQSSCTLLLVTWQFSKLLQKNLFKICIQLQCRTKILWHFYYSIAKINWRNSILLRKQKSLIFSDIIWIKLMEKLEDKRTYRHRGQMNVWTQRTKGHLGTEDKRTYRHRGQNDI